MRIDTLNERIANAKAKIEKKENTISKKMALISKKEDKLVKLGLDEISLETIREICRERGNNDAFWLACDIDSLKEDIERLRKEIKETKESLEKYEGQLAGELEKESILLREIPESMKRMQSELVERWDRWDMRHRDHIKACRSEMSYEEWCKTFSANDRMSFMYLTDEQIHKYNEQDAKVLILNLYKRVKAITGEVTDWSGITCEMGNMGAVLTGYVVGKEGRAEVETILAGGYNIQRLHVRTLVHER